MLEGTIFAADPVLNAIAINTTPAPPNPSTSLASQPGNFHVVSIPNIQEFKILPGEDGSPDGFESAMPTIAALDLNVLKAREESAVRKLLEKEATRGRGVPKEAQEIFDAINRTYVQRFFFFFPSRIAQSPHTSSLPSLAQDICMLPRTTITSPLFFGNYFEILTAAVCLPAGTTRQSSSMMPSC